MDNVHKLPEGEAAKDGEAKQPYSRRFSSDEVADIMRHSLQNADLEAENSIDFEELLVIGREMGVDEAQLRNSIKQLEEERRTRDKADDLWLRFRAHLITYCMTSFGLAMINLIVYSEFLWFLFPVIGWGLVLAGHYLGLRYAPDFVQMATERTWQLGEAGSVNRSGGASLSYSVDDEMLGLSETRGLLFIDGDELVVEYQTSDALFGVMHSGIRERRIPLDQIADIDLQHRFWSTKLVLRASSMRTFSQLPGATGTRLSVPVDGHDQGAAIKLINEFEQARAEA